MEQLFLLSSLLVLPFWLLMIVLPHWRWTQRIMRSPLVVVPNALIYAILVLPRLSEIVSSFDSVASVAALLGAPTGTVIAWAHFLAFDLFVGRWAYLDSREQGVHPVLMAPVLVLTFLLGPLGFLLYLVVREVGAGASADLLRQQNMPIARAIAAVSDHRKDRGEGREGSAR
jgi:hypothetical protein